MALLLAKPVRNLGRLGDRLRASLGAGIGDVTFGMEDGAVSVAGLVFGVAASTHSSSTVILAGATGAVAGAVSMMAGRYLDVQSANHRLDVALEDVRALVTEAPEPYLERAGQRMLVAGFTIEEVAVLRSALHRNPDALVAQVSAFEVGLGGRVAGSPWIHATWMFVADILAASIPVLPFMLFDIGPARLISMGITGGLMALLGVARGRLGGVNIWRAAVQTMAIAGAAALAGILIGHLVTG